MYEDTKGLKAKFYFVFAVKDHYLVIDFKIAFAVIQVLAGRAAPVK